MGRNLETEYAIMLDSPAKIGTITLLYALAAVSGGVGGCSAAALSKVVGRRHMTLSLMFAYAMIGLALSVMMIVFGEWVLDVAILDSPHLIGYSFLSGCAGTLLLVAHNVVARMVLEKFGIRIELTIGDKNDRKKP